MREVPFDARDYVRRRQNPMKRLINIEMPRSFETMLLHLMGREFATLESFAEILWGDEWDYPLVMGNGVRVRIAKLRAYIKPKGRAIVSHGRLGWKLERIGG